MKKPIIAIDYDDVIINSAPYTIKHYNKTYGTKLNLKDFYSKEVASWGTDSYATAIKRVNDYALTDEFQNIAPTQVTIKAIQHLSKQYELHIVTGRSDFLLEATHKILDTYFPNLFQSVEFTNFFSDKPRSKAHVCMQLGADILIDDHLHHAKVVAECGTRVLLFGDYPWNSTDMLPPNIERARNWHEVEQLLLAH